MLESITNQRPSSRNDNGNPGSRKGARNSRKVGATTVTGNQVSGPNDQGNSHSQDSRPALPHVSLAKGA